MPSARRLSAPMRDEILGALSGFEPAVIYLFGSFAGGDIRPDSDIDIAFLPGKPSDPLACFETANRLADALGREVDLVDLSRASTVLAKEVLRTGVAIQVADETRRAEFEMLALSDYARLNEERKPVLAR
jgi:predicted nucleotidyltransferase